MLLGEFTKLNVCTKIHQNDVVEWVCQVECRWYAKGATKIAKHVRALDQSVALWGSESAIRG